jgi:hypothetical protein
MTVKAQEKRERSLFPLFVTSALRGWMTPKLAADAEINLDPLTRTLTADDWTPERKERLAHGVVKALKGAKLAKDADPDDVQGVIEVLDTLDEIKEDIAPAIAEAAAGDMPSGNPDEAKDADGDEMSQVRDFLSDKLSPEDLQKVMSMLDPGYTPDMNDDKLNPSVKRALLGRSPRLASDAVSKPAMDAAIAEAVAAAEARAIQATVDRMKNAELARKDVRPLVGDLDVALDSAETVYAAALDMKGIDRKGVHPSAYAALIKLAVKTSNEQRSPRAAVAVDGDYLAGINERFPGARHLKRS